MGKDRRERFKHCLICKTENVAPNHYIGNICLNRLPFKERQIFIHIRNHGQKLNYALKLARKVS
jgi:hypothetical protein